MQVQVLLCTGAGGGGAMRASTVSCSRLCRDACRAIHGIRISIVLHPCVEGSSALMLLARVLLVFGEEMAACSSQVFPETRAVRRVDSCCCGLTVLVGLLLVGCRR